MLAISSNHAAELMVDIVLIFAAIIFPLDRPNDRAERPIP